MSISTQDPMNPEALEMLKEMFGEPVAKSDNTQLFDKLNALNRKEMSKLANAANQAVTVELNDIGDTKTLGDVDYILTKNGWERQPIGGDNEKV